VERRAQAVVTTNLNHRPMSEATDERSHLLRRLGAFDAALIVMGGIIGSGIFVNPSVVARYVHTAPLVLWAWVIGGAIALIGASVFAELGARRPRDGGVYAYLRDAFHPVVAFCYGWTLLLVSQSGGTAAAAVTFAFYLPKLSGLHLSATETTIVAVVIIAIFTIVNCLGVREGASTQNLFMILKIAAIVGVVAVGAFALRHSVHAPAASFPPFNPVAAIGLALVPVMFSYSGWQTSSFMTAELHEPHRSLPLGMLYGVLGVILLYLAVNVVCLAVLGTGGLAATNTPASDVVQSVFGSVGAKIMASVVALSTLGFISNQILTSPRVYYQMAADGTFFKALAKVNARTHVPVTAIALQGAVAVIITLSGGYATILNWVTSVDYSFFGFSALAIMIFRARDRQAGVKQPSFLVPGHPITTILFLVTAWSIVLDIAIASPKDSAIGLGVLLTGIPVYYFFTRR
jgi:basic amino acid/polyamine antiporter, APA family